MPVQLTDEEIGRLIRMPKPFSPSLHARLLATRLKRGHRESEADVDAEDGTRFHVRVRQSAVYPLDFSVILAYRPPNSNQLFILRRYNGNAHEHANSIEGSRFSGFHVHTATGRYQELGGVDEETYAEPADRYADLATAVNCMLRECGFQLPGGMLQGILFPEEP